MIDVPQDCTSGACHYSDALWKPWQGSLLRSIKQSLCRKSVLELLKSQGKVTSPLRSKRIRIQLIDTITFINRDTAGSYNLQTIDRSESQMLRPAAEHHAF